MREREKERDRERGELDGERGRSTNKTDFCRRELEGWKNVLRKTINQDRVTCIKEL